METSLNYLLKKVNFFALSLMIVCFPIFADTASQEVINAKQETQIWTTYALSPYLRANDIKVSVNEGKAKLEGTVDEDVNRDLAEAIALGVTGIKAVENNIKVVPDYQPNSDTSGYGSHIDDVNITSAVKSKLLWSKYINTKLIKVETINSKVTLSGNVDTQKSRELAERLAKGTPGVISVTNNLEVNKTPGSAGMAKASIEETGSTLSDSWITTKIKSTYLYSRNVNSADISVNTDNGVVTLSGKVNSGVERALAIELAQNIRGVKSVQAKELVN